MCGSLDISLFIIFKISLLKRLPQDASPESRLIEICENLGRDSLYEGAAGKNHIDKIYLKEPILI